MSDNYDDYIPALSGFLAAYPRYSKYDSGILGELFNTMTASAIEEDMIPAELWLDMYSKEYCQKKTALFNAESVVADMTAYLISFFGFERLDPADFAPDIRRIVKRHLSCGRRVEPSRVEAVTALLIKNFRRDGIFSPMELFLRLADDPLLSSSDPLMLGEMIQDLFERFEEIGVITGRKEID